MAVARPSGRASVTRLATPSLTVGLLPRTRSSPLAGLTFPPPAPRATIFRLCLAQHSRLKRRDEMRISVSVVFLLFAAANAFVAAAQTLNNSAATRPPARDVVSTRELERINWMEFKEAVPSKVQTVLLPTGTLEPHGVINNG